tara:strand:+ start:826 stop:1563 length:738 start_codon:yes stop_codon:yes gene_type:complete
MKQLQFNFKLLPSIAFFIVFFCLVRLGFWQLERADQKTQLNNNYKLRQSDQVVNLNVTNDINDQASILWRKVSVKGSFKSGANLMLDNQIFRHVAGFNLLTPFTIEGSGMSVLVNRGWHPNLMNREQVPFVKDLSEVEMVNGYAVKLPVPGINLGGSNIEPINASLARFQKIDLDEINQFYQSNFLPYIIYLNPLMDNEYISNFKLPVPDSEKNYGYAFQWFAFAFTLLIIFLRLGITRNDKPTK